MSRQDQSKITVIVNQPDGKPWPGLGNRGTWDVKDGGGMDTTSTKYRIGGMGGQLSLGGTKDVQNITLNRLQVSDRDWPLLETWYDAAGVANVVISETPLDGRGTPNGDTMIWHGKLKRVTPGNANANSQDAKLFEIEVETYGSVDRVPLGQ